MSAGRIPTFGEVRRLQAVLCALCAVLGLAFSAAVAQPARAQLNVTAGVSTDLSLATSLNLATPARPASSLKEVFANSPTSLAQALLCPAGQVLSTTTDPVPGAGALTDQLTSVLCAVSIVGYAYRTTYIPPSGPRIVRYHRAVALVPALLDVNGDALPDFTGKLIPNLTLNSVQLSISRNLGFPAEAKVSIEAVLLDPASPQTYLGFGEDGTAAGTAANWNATVSVFALSSSTVDLGLAVGASGAPSKLTALGEVFSGSDADAPENITRGKIAFAPVPSTFTTKIRASQTRQQAIVNSTVPSKVTGDVDVIRPGKEKNVDVVVDKLPASIDLVHTTSSGHENTTYTASAPVGALSGAYRERSGSSILTAARLDATAVPAKITLDQADGKTIVDAPTGAFGSVEVRFAKGAGVPSRGSGTEPYLAFHRFSESKLAAGLRLTNLKSVALDQSGPYASELIFSQPLGSVPLSARDDVSGITLTGSLSNLPLHTTLLADVNNGVVTFDGHGTGINQIALKATKTAGTFFSRASRIDATIDNVPARETINFKQVDGAVTVAASNPPGAIALLASDGSDAPSVSGSYAWYEDTPSTYRAFVRLSGLKGIAFSPSPVFGSIDAAAQVLNLHGTAGAVTFDGTIDKLSAHVGFTAPDDRVHIDSSSPIDHINLKATNLPGDGPFRNAKVDIFGTSPVLDIYLGADPATAGSARAGRLAAARGVSTSALPRENCPPEEEPCEEPPCPPEAEPCEEPPCPPEAEPCDEPPPPPPPPDPKLYGIDAHGDGIDLITVHAWADDADLPSHPDLTGPGNEIRYDAKVAGHEDLRARIVNLKKAFYTQDAVPTGPNGYAVPNGTDDVDIQFTQPEPITLAIKKERLDGTITIPQVPGRQLPTKYGLRLGTKRVINAIFTPNATIPTVQIGMAVGKDLDGGERRALITGNVNNIPTHAEVCIAKDSFPDCGGWLFDAPGGAGNIVIPGEIDFNVSSNAPPVTHPLAMSVNARICLGDIASNAWVPASCELDQVAKKYIDIDNLRVRNFDLEYRGNGVADKYQGNYQSDDSLAAYLNTDGVLVDNFRYVKDGGKGVEFIKTGAPLTAHNFFAALNYSASARVGFMYGPIGTLSCPGPTSLYLLERNSVTGEVTRYDIPGPLPNNLWQYVTLFIDC